MSPGTIAIIVLAVITIVLLATIIILAFTKYSVPKPVVNSPVSIVGLYYSCRNGNKCRDGLICDGPSQMCKVPDGIGCSSYADCLTGSFCSGVCVKGAYGGLNQYCPCNELSLVCSTVPGGINTCKRVAGGSCSQNSDCASSLCTRGICSSSLPIGSKCVSSSQCGENVCDSFGFCQINGTTSGEEGAFCVAGQPPPGSGGTGPGCARGLFCQNSLCVPASSGLGDSCGSVSTCAPPFICTDTDSLLSCSLVEGESCVCALPPNPNTCPSGICSDGYICRGSSFLCVGQPSQPCVVGGDCAGSCLDAPVVMRLSPSPLEVITSTNVSWILHSTAPERFSKLIGEDTSDSPLFGIGQSGLWQYVNRVSPLTSGWSIAIPRVTTASGRTRNFENVAVKRQENGTVLHYVAFDEVGSSLADRTLYSMIPNSAGSAPRLTPYNVSNRDGHIDGAQYTTDETPIIFSDLSISTSNDILLWNGTTTYWVKPSLNPNYNVLTLPNSGTMPAFYFDISRTIPYISTDNVSYVGNLPTNSGTFVVQFIGSAVDAIYPQNPPDAIQSSYTTTAYSIYSPIGTTPDSGMSSATGGVVARNLTTGRSSIYLITGGQQIVLPGFSDAETLVNATAGDLFLYSDRSCG